MIVIGGCYKIENFHKCACMFYGMLLSNWEPSLCCEIMVSSTILGLVASLWWHNAKTRHNIVRARLFSVQWVYLVININSFKTAVKAVLTCIDFLVRSALFWASLMSSIAKATCDVRKTKSSSSRCLLYKHRLFSTTLRWVKEIWICLRELWHFVINRAPQLPQTQS